MSTEFRKILKDTDKKYSQDQGVAKDLAFLAWLDLKRRLF